MAYIKILSDDLIGKIAAGEVVERPASVVKELVENSIDAGSKEIIIEIASGGRKRIAVIDDGFGMSPSDAKLSIQRHATSKISTADDLNKIKTMGFRGEALPSIAAVSKMTIETNGFKLVISGGTAIEEGDFGCPAGTRIVIDDLFFNTPARKKFLRSDKTEEGHIIDAISRLAMAFPPIRFKFISEGKEKLACLSVDNPEARLSEIFRNSLAESAVPFNETGDGISIHGFLGRPESSRQIAQGVYLFVNKRFVRDRLLNHAVLDGYRSLLPRGSYPFAVVFLEIDPERVDVNVHPTKQEVRFDNSGAVHNFVAMAVRKTMGKPRCSSGMGDDVSEVIARSPST
ncbi:MAG: DNA mismatch repair endonuclease MutL, partial [Deltaproteobacteria bacterium]|nr:DNA mismatch repair endonuclease MutL [Deltaproteobacteria bacterium]